MKIKYLGTGAAEGIPAMFCNCEVCKYARKMGGKEIRTRSQALIAGKLLIDFPADSYTHILKEGMDLSSVAHLLITHSHDDHFYPFDLLLRLPDYGKNWGVRQMNVYGNHQVNSLLREMGERYSVPGIWEYLIPHEIKPFDVLEIDGYEITCLPARHMEKEEALVFLIEKDHRLFLYGNDTGIPGSGFWEGLNGRKLDGVSMDCTMGREMSPFWGHMGYEDVRSIRTGMEQEKISGADTKWIITHFSHNGGWRAADMDEELDNSGFEAAYDGMEIEV